MGAGDGPLRIRSHREARHTEKRRLLLKPARVGDHDPGARDHAEHVQVTERLEQPQSPLGQRPPQELLNLLARARMHREQHGDVFRQPRQRVEQFPEHYGIVDIGRPMQRHDRVGTTPDTQARRRVQCHRLWQRPAQRVDHDVANEVHAVGGNALGREILRGIPRRQE